MPFSLMKSAVESNQAAFSRKHLYCRIALFDRAWFLNQLPRVVQLANYSARMQRAGVPDKVRLKILRRYRPLSYAIRQELAALVQDMRCRAV